MTKRFGAAAGAGRRDLTIHAGQTVALIGPSGGGKSTLLRCINGLNAVRRGRDPRRPARAPRRPRPPPDRRRGPAVRRLFGMIFQDFQLFPHLTALDNVIEAPVHVLGLPKAEARQRAMALLARVGLADRADAYPRELSGGQKQRVAIARAMAMEPRGLLVRRDHQRLGPRAEGRGAGACWRT